MPRVTAVFVPLIRRSFERPQSATTLQRCTGSRSKLGPIVRAITTLCAACVLVSLPAHCTTLTFEGLQDLEAVNAFYPDVTFTNAIAEIAGFSLNDAEVPPLSGTTVALNDDGLITIDWVFPVFNFSGFFTYTAPLTVEFFLSGASVGTVTSAFGNNLALSGEPGSSPNEHLSFQNTTFNSLQVQSSGAYAVDDISFDAAVQAVPEPGTAVSVIAGLLALLYIGHRLRIKARQAAFERRVLMGSSEYRGQQATSGHAGKY